MVWNISLLFAIRDYRSETKCNRELYRNYVKAVGNYFIALEANKLVFLLLFIYLARVYLGNVTRSVCIRVKCRKFISFARVNFTPENDIVCPLISVNLIQCRCRITAKAVERLRRRSQEIRNPRQRKIMKDVFSFFSTVSSNPICGKAASSIIRLSRYVVARRWKKIAQVFRTGGSFFFLINVRPWIPGCRYSSRPFYLLSCRARLCQPF